MKFSVDKVKKALFLNEDETSQLSDREKENIKKDAESKGLVSLGFGNYGKEKGAEASHKVKDGKLISISDDDGDNKEPQVKTQDREPPQAASDSADDVIGTALGDDTENNNSEIQSRIDQNRDKIEKFRDMRNNISSEDDMTKYEDYLLNTIENNHETIGDALDELINIEDSFDEKDPITNFTSQAYDGAGHRLSMISLAARYPDGNTSDFRVERMKKRCEEKDPQYARDCENYSPNDTPTEKDIEAFKKLQQNQQQSLVDLGLVDEDGMVTVYRGMSGLGDQGPVDYKGSAVDSWSMSPRTAWAFSEAYDSKNMLKAKVPLDRVILAAASSTEEQFNHSYEFEVTIDSIGLDNVESVDSSGDMKKIMENTMAKTKMRIIKKNGKYKIIKESKGIPVDINNDKDTDWLRSNRKEKEKEQVEEGVIEEAFKINVYEKGRMKQNKNTKEFYYWYKNSKGEPVSSTDSNAEKQKYEPIEPDDKLADKIPDNQKPPRDTSADPKKSKSDDSQDKKTQGNAEPAQGTAGNDSSADDVIGVATGDDGDDKRSDVDVLDPPQGVMTDDDVDAQHQYLEDAIGKNKRVEKPSPVGKNDLWKNQGIDKPSDADFDKKMKTDGRYREDNRIKIEDVLKQSGIKEPYPFPPKYLKLLERMINTKGLANPKNDSISYFVDGAGAGMISSQAGEILTMMVSSIKDDEQAQKFSESIMSVVSQQDRPILDKTWVTAAMKNRESILRHVRETYGEDAYIDASCWDIKEEAEALGMQDYEKNKGYSTDAYFTVTRPNSNKRVMLEVSLKKDANVMFYNGGTGDMLKPKCVSVDPSDPKGCAPMGWGLDDEDFVDLDNGIKGEDYHPNRFADKQNKIYRDNAKQLADKKKISAALERMSAEDKAEMIKYLNKGTFSELLGEGGPIENINDERVVDVLSSIMGNLESQYDENGKKTKNKPQYATKETNKLCMLLGKGDSKDCSNVDTGAVMGEVYGRMCKEHRDYQSNLATALLENRDLRDNLMNILKAEFPIKAAANGEEIMSIGDMVLDRKTCEKMFGTSNFEEIKDRLVIKEINGSPAVVYEAAGTGEYISLAAVDIRQKGVGYSGVPSFNLKVHKDFAKQLKKAQGNPANEQIEIPKYLQRMLDRL